MVTCKARSASTPPLRCGRRGARGQTIENKTDILGNTVKNSDGSPVQEVKTDGETTSEIENKTDILGNTVKNRDGTPVKEVSSQ
ncbi:MAG: hypothetical protein WDM79_18705 [Terricaulis sp.]